MAISTEELFGVFDSCGPNDQIKIEFDRDSFEGPKIICRLADEGVIVVIPPVAHAIMECVVREQRWAAVANRTVLIRRGSPGFNRRCFAEELAPYIYSAEAVKAE